MGHVTRIQYRPLIKSRRRLNAGLQITSKMPLRGRGDPLALSSRARVVLAKQCGPGRWGHIIIYVVT